MAELKELLICSRLPNTFADLHTMRVDIETLDQFAQLAFTSREAGRIQLKGQSSIYVQHLLHLAKAQKPGLPVPL